MKTATKNDKIRPLCPDILALDAKTENFTRLEGVKRDVVNASMSLSQSLLV